jgi:hypothetical protein
MVYSITAHGDCLYIFCSNSLGVQVLVTMNINTMLSTSSESVDYKLPLQHSASDASGRIYANGHYSADVLVFENGLPTPVSQFKLGDEEGLVCKALCVLQKENELFAAVEVETPFAFENQDNGSCEIRIVSLSDRKWTKTISNVRCPNTGSLLDKSFSVMDIAVDETNHRLYVAGGLSGLWSFEISGSTCRKHTSCVFAERVAVDTEGNVFVSNFGGSSENVIYKYQEDGSLDLTYQVKSKFMKTKGCGGICIHNGRLMAYDQPATVILF